MKPLSILKNYAKVITTPPWGGTIPSNISEYLNQNSLISQVWRRLKRDLILLITLQFFLARKKLPRSAKNILYVYLGTPQLGDSIMDLSSRVLWSAQGLEVEIFTHPTIASYYLKDPSFKKIITNPVDLKKKYDLIVLQSYSIQCLKFKWRYVFFHPYATLHGHYYGCEFNRLEFADGAWRHILNISKNQYQVVCPPIFNLKNKHFFHHPKAKRIALALGGATSWRTYPHWLEIIRSINNYDPELEWILLGSDNGKEVAESIVIALSEKVKVVDLVGLMSLDQVHEQLQTIMLLIAADGGLLHLGSTMKVPTVGLFAGQIHPRMRFSLDYPAYVIHSPTEVTSIPPKQVTDVIKTCLQTLPDHLIIKYLGTEPNCSY